MASGYSHNIALTGILSPSLLYRIHTPPPLHNTSLSDDGDVYTWGNEAYMGQMGLYPTVHFEPIAQPQRVPDLAKGITHVYAGAYYSFIVYDGVSDKYK